jgi:N-acetylglucosaminyl-diphospho-decaprenol L-rhamnosyltransferase
MDTPRVLVVVVTHNNRPYFARLRAALEAQSVKFDLCVIDNASRTDQRPTRADFPVGATLIQSEKNLGFAAANNLAAASFRGEYLALINPDAFPEPDWLHQLIAAAESNPQAAAFGSTQIADENPKHFDGLGDCYSIAGVPWRGGHGWKRTTTTAAGGETFSICAAAALYRNADWRAAGGFDESFFCYCEDVDLGFRLRLSGRSSMQVPSAIVRHIGSASSGRRSRFAVFHGTRNRIWTLAKNVPLPLLPVVIPFHLMATLLFALLAPVRGTAIPTWGGICAAFPAMGRVLRQRREIQRKKKAGAIEIARAMSWWPHEMLTRAPVIRGLALPR